MEGGRGGWRGGEGDGGGGGGMFRCTFEGMFGRTIIPLYKVVSKAGWRPPIP